MKAKVLIPFKDRATKKEHKQGDIIEVTAKRFNEITRKGRYIELVETVEAPAKEKVQETAPEKTENSPKKA